MIKWALALGGALLLTSTTLAQMDQEHHEARTAVAAPSTLVYNSPTSAEQVNLNGLPDFRVYEDVATKKTKFFGYLLPLVQAENARLDQVRLRLSHIHDHQRWGQSMTADDAAWLKITQNEFRLSEADINSPEFWTTLFSRVDAVPEDLVLVQAANESAWGTSRFAREGNNLFGQWCFEEGCGIVPAGRPAGETYEVARYESVIASIGSYLHNLNTGRTYSELRQVRAQMRAEGDQPSAIELAAGLSHYSQRGEAYVEELQAMIRVNAKVIDQVRDSGTPEGNL